MNTIDPPDTLFVKEEEVSLRLDKLLAQRFPEHSRTYFQGLIEKGHVLINGKPCKKRERLLPQDEIEICFALTPELSLEAENIPLEILFEDDDLLVVNKPAGMVVHPAPGHYQHTFVNALLYHCQHLEAASCDPLRPGIVHRLDKDTSGALIAAKTTFAHKALVELLSQRKIEKHYKALCLNTPSQTEIIAPIKRHPIKRQEMAVAEEGGKEAITRLKVLTKSQEASFLDIHLITGRTHQIRVHLKHIGCPILGDPVYGNPKSKGMIARQLLHAERLSFLHPRTQKLIRIVAPLPQDMQDWIQKLFPNYSTSTF
jgi:23S rRNA pseudouridine1911/1915/1917 synthase